MAPLSGATSDLARPLVESGAAEPLRSTAGMVELYGTTSTLDGIIVGGWIDFSWDDPIDPPLVVMQTEDRVIAGEGLMCLFPRDDIRKRGFGFLLLIETQDRPEAALVGVVLRTAARTVFLPPAEGVEVYAEERLFRHARHFLRGAQPNERRRRFRKLLDRSHYAGADTLSSYEWPVHLETDKFYFCPPRGLMVRGWFLDPFRRVSRIRLCCAGATQVLDPALWIKVRRRDVAEAFLPRYGSVDDMCGFVAYAPSLYGVGQQLFFEVEMTDGTVAFRPATPSLMTGLAAIKEVLSGFELRRGALACGYDGVIGPAVEAMNRFRLGRKPDISTLAFGAGPPAPRCSIVIPLYGRVDFLEYQLAFFADTLSPDHEIIYVLDDPERAAETQALATSAHARFERPFTLLVLSHNVGFAPANNIGLARSKGAAVCFLNSDVFPRDPDWLERLLETQAAEPDIGLVGARLLYEDGTLQHDGCTFERLPDFAGWPFPMHPGKGRRARAAAGVTTVPVVTGACMVLPRPLADELGGFDEGYVIGDFEDADLCLRVGEKGLRCVVDDRAALYHLERQSQGLQADSWRMNLTLYNAWRFQSRWGDHVV